MVSKIETLQDLYQLQWPHMGAKFTSIRSNLFHRTPDPLHDVTKLNLQKTQVITDNNLRPWTSIQRMRSRG